MCSSREGFSDGSAVRRSCSGGGLRRNGCGHSTQAAGPEQPGDPRARGRSGWNLARQPLSRSGCRHRVGHLLVFVRAQSELVQAFRTGRGTEEVRRSRRGQVRSAEAHDVRCRGQRSPLGRGFLALGRIRRRRAGHHCQVPPDCDGFPLATASGPTSPVSTTLPARSSTPRPGTIPTICPAPRPQSSEPAPPLCS